MAGFIEDGNNILDPNDLPIMEIPLGDFVNQVGRNRNARRFVREDGRVENIAADPRAIVEVPLIRAEELLARNVQRPAVAADLDIRARAYYQRFLNEEKAGRNFRGFWDAGEEPTMVQLYDHIEDINEVVTELIEGLDEENLILGRLRCDGYGDIYQNNRFAIKGLLVHAPNFNGDEEAIVDEVYDRGPMARLFLRGLFVTRLHELFHDFADQFVTGLIHVIFRDGYRYSTVGMLPEMITKEFLWEWLAVLDGYGELEEPYGARNDDLFVRFVEYTIPAGRGFKEGVQAQLTKPKTVDIVESVKLCGVVSLILGMNPAARENNLKPARRELLFRKARDLATTIGVGDSMDVTEFAKFTEKYPEFNVRVYTANGSLITYTKKTAKTIYILWIEDHFMHINNINGFMNSMDKHSIYCTVCDTLCSKHWFGKHPCAVVKCDKCYITFDNAEELKVHLRYTKFIECDRCYYNFRDNCYAVHRKHCKREDKCAECHQAVTSHHICGEIKCTQCNLYVYPLAIGTGANAISLTGKEMMERHRCFIAKAKIKNSSTRHYAYDIESTITDNVHKASIICLVEIGSETPETLCFDVKEFIGWVTSQKRMVVLWAHNAKSYDNYLLIHIFISTQVKVDNVVAKGMKILAMTAGRVKFIDSMNHLPGSLQSQIATFGLSSVLARKYKVHCKGFFPYTFYTEANRNYIGALPERKYFNFDSSLQAEFDEWYLSMVNTVYNIDAECRKYCIQDCQILAEALHVYSKEATAINEVDPLSCITIAAYTMKVYKTNHLPSGTIVRHTLDEYNFCKRAMQGGRTSTFVLHKRVPKDTLDKTRIDYADVVSMYPSVLRYDYMPAGMAGVIEYDDISPVAVNHEIINKSFGFIECDITPNRSVMIPPLLVKDLVKNKLVDTLEPMVKVVYTSVELQLAIEMGYKVTRIYKMHLYAKRNDMFAGYIDKYIGLKNQASVEMKDSDPDIAAAAIGKRSIAKSMLNNLWGKFGQNDDITFTDYFSTPSDWFKLVRKERNREIDIIHTEVIDEILYTRYKDINKTKVKLNNTNMAIAAFTTANARVRLYRAFMQIGVNSGRILYCDTDSVIYNWEVDKPNLEYGDNLGDFKLETNSPIVEFASLGPKTYAYVTLDDEKCVKSKGFSVGKFKATKETPGLTQKITLETYKYLLEVPDSSVEYGYSQFVRGNRQIVTQEMKKILKFDYDKREINADLSTKPFGYVA
mgnify:CR=1 FL=1|tara:strand:- start:903 stop:4562 length:3660 start_codon:yes stop_codon:yes gene_type:complete